MNASFISCYEKHHKKKILLLYAENDISKPNKRLVPRKSTEQSKLWFTLYKAEPSWKRWGILEISRLKQYFTITEEEQQKQSPF